MLAALDTAVFSTLPETLPRVKPECRYKSNWLMEDWMAFVETFSLFLLHDLPWDDDEDGEVREVFEDLWGKLRIGVLYFMRFEEGQHTAGRILEAQKSLLNYGKRAEEVRSSLPPVLHSNNCHSLR